MKNTPITEDRVVNLTTDLAGKQATLISGTNIKTVGGESLLGPGNVEVSGGLTQAQVINLAMLFGGG